MSRLAAVTITVTVVLAVAVPMSACDRRSAVGLPCVNDDNCPSGLACADGACAGLADARDVRSDDVPVRELPSLLDDGAITSPYDDAIGEPGNPDVGPVDPGDPVNPDDPSNPDEPLDPVEPTPGWSVVAYDVPLYDKPRVVAGVPGAGSQGVEVYFLEGTIGTASTCDGLSRAFPNGSLDPLVGPASGGCFKELDAQRTGDGVVHVVMRSSFTEFSDVVFVDFGPELVADTAFAPEADDDHRGVRARVALTPEGDPDWLWSVRQASGPDLIEQLHLASTSPDVVLEVDELVDDLDYAIDSEGFGALFVTKLLSEKSLVLRTRNTSVAVAVDVEGAVEAVRCGGALHVVYRKADQLLVARAVGPSVTGRTVIAEGLSSNRTRGDVAIACDDGNIWTAWTDAGAAHVAAPGGPVEVVSAGGGGISLAVVDGAPHIAFGSTSVNGALRYATRP